MLKILTSSLLLSLHFSSVVTSPAPLGVRPIRELQFTKRTTVYSTTPSCAPFWLGQGEAAKSEVCLTILDGNLVVTFKDVVNYDYKEVQLWLGCEAPTESAPGQLGAALQQYCVVAADKQTATCTVPLAVVPTCGTELCNKKLFIATHGALTGPSEETGWGMGHCINGGQLPAEKPPLCPGGNWAQYWDFTITCTDVPEPPKVCDIGTAFGYFPAQSSNTLNTLSPLPNSCKRWGWYITSTISELSSGINGKLIVGAGGNDVLKGTQVGTFSISLSAGVPTVQYALSSTYDLSEAHIYAACGTKPTTCAPGQYTWVNEALTGNADQSLSVPFPSLSSCTGTIYFILHAKVNGQLPAGTTCPTPVA